MAKAFSSAGGSGVLLFDEDFDLPAKPPEPEVIEPVFTAAELAAAREEATQESRDRAIAEVDGTARSASSRALTEIAAQITCSAGGSRSDCGTVGRGDRAPAARLFRDRVSRR